MPTTPPTRDELIAALGDPDPANPLARAVAACISAYAAELDDQASRIGAWPDPLVLPAPATEVEAFAFELFVQQMAASNIGIRIKGDS
jgi:hypothetical protein